MPSDYHASVEKRLAEAGLQLPKAMAPAANYVPYKIAGDQLYVSGQVSATSDGTLIKGRCGDDISLEDAVKAAETCALNLLAQAQAAVEDFDRIEGLTKLTAFVQSTPDFGDQPKVVNGASDLFVAVLGDRGRHARSAVGMAALPFGVAVEIDAVFQLKG
ncbi:MAG: RidA family protein [Pseudomonadota bacterium]